MGHSRERESFKKPTALTSSKLSVEMAFKLVQRDSNRHTSSVKTISVPHEFQKLERHSYLEHQEINTIETNAAEQLAKNAPSINWSYLPVFWTSYAARCNEAPRWMRKWFGTTSWRMKHLHRFCIQQVQTSPYPVFTVVQHAEGLHLHKHLDIASQLLVFSAGGKGDIPLPLLCKPRPRPTCKRDLLASFKGVIQHPHHDYPFREAMATHFGQDPRFVIIDTNQCTKEEQAFDYIELMVRSEFSLCPRGFGKTSYRLYEALQQGSIPVYIHDGNPWLPYRDEISWSSFAVIIDYRDLEQLPAKLERITTEQREAMRRIASDLLQTHFSMEGSCDYIVRKMTELNKMTLDEARLHTAPLR